MGFSVFYWAYIGIGTGFQLVSIGFSLDCTWFYRVIANVIEFYWVLLGFTEFCLVISGFTRFYWVLQGFTGSHVISLLFF